MRKHPQPPPRIIDPTEIPDEPLIDGEEKPRRRRLSEPQETASGPTIAAVICPLAHERADGDQPAARSASAVLEEAIGLARAIDLDVRIAETVPLRQPVPATLLGRGAVERIKAAIEEQHVKVA